MNEFDLKAIYIMRKGSDDSIELFDAADYWTMDGNPDWYTDRLAEAHELLSMGEFIAVREVTLRVIPEGVKEVFRTPTLMAAPLKDEES